MPDKHSAFAKRGILAKKSVSLTVLLRVMVRSDDLMCTCQEPKHEKMQLPQGKTESGETHRLLTIP